MDEVKEHMKKVREFMAKPPFEYHELSNDDVALFSRALTHISFTSEASNINVNVESYQRLEFLGDAVIEFLACDYIYANSNLREGKMTNFKQEVVANKKISKKVIEYGLNFDNLILAGKSYGTGKESINDNIRADCFEALIGAIYLIKGMDEAKRIVSEILLPKSRSDLE